MNGSRIVLDTNAIVFLLDGNKQIINILKDAKWIGISVISCIEFKAFSGLDKSDEQLFDEFIKRVEVIGILPSNDELIERVIRCRRKYRIKIPDAIIASTALSANASLLTADSDFEKIKELTLVKWKAE